MHTEQKTNQFVGSFHNLRRDLKPALVELENGERINQPRNVLEASLHS